MSISNDDSLIIRLPHNLLVSYRALCKDKNVSVSSDLRLYIQSIVSGASVLPELRAPNKLNASVPPLTSVPHSQNEQDKKMKSAIRAAANRKKKKK